MKAQFLPTIILVEAVYLNYCCVYGVNPYMKYAILL